jgi:hypothetical protein
LKQLEEMRHDYRIVRIYLKKCDTIGKVLTANLPDPHIDTDGFSVEEEKTEKIGQSGVEILLTDGSSLELTPNTAAAAVDVTLLKLTPLDDLAKA